MSNELINQSELNNSGHFIHCHYHSSNETWIAYGKSAYVLQTLVKNVGLHSIDRFSPELDMASVMVGNKVISSICTECGTVQKQERGYMCISHNQGFDNNKYEEWVTCIKEASSKKNNQWVHTIISDEVSHNEFIADGMSAFARNTKRLVDFFASLFALIVFSPLFAITFLLVKLEDGGPAIFKQERIGRFGRPFNIYKFRSMRLDAEKYGPQLSHSGGDNDPRLTKVGRFIRAHHLDELPQLWNVFCGDMAFIGPRPERKFYIDQIMEYDKRYAYLYQIRPGVTSYATLYNGYTDTMEKMLRRLEFDLYYLSHRSWAFDIKILFNTFCAIMFGKKF